MLNSIVALLNGGAGGGGGSYESIATVTLTGSAADVTFSSIPSTYTALQVRGIVRSDSGTTSGYDWLYLRFNADTGANYATHSIYGNGTSANVYSVASNTYIIGGVATRAYHTSGNFGTTIIDVHDYASTARNKTVRSFSGYDNNGSGDVELESGVWLSTSAITSLKLTPQSSNFVAGTTLALYGIKGA